MRAMKIGIIAVVVLLTIGGLALWLLASNLDDLVARALEHHGSRMTGTAVTVAGVSIDLREGRATIRGLRVANPDGFSDRDAVSVAEITVQIDPGSVRSEPHRLPLIRVADPRVLFEVNDQVERNLDVLRANLDRDVAAHAGRAGDGGEAGGGEAGGGAGVSGQDGEAAAQPAPRLIIDRAEFTGGQVQADASALGVEARTVQLSAFTLTGLGAPDGAPADALGRQALDQLARQALEAVVGSEVQDRLREQLEQRLGQEAADRVREQAGDLLQGLGR
jgi:hypothetical protein